MVRDFEYSHRVRDLAALITSNFLAIYFTLTGLHSRDSAAWWWTRPLGPGAKLWETNPGWFTNRVEHSGLFWHFVDLVWIFLFPTLYLL